MSKNMEKEIWKPVVGYEEMYEVSNLGRVRSLAFVYPWRGSFKTNKPTRFSRGSMSKANYERTVRFFLKIITR